MRRPAARLVPATAAVVALCLSCAKPVAYEPGRGSLSPLPCEYFLVSGSQFPLFAYMNRTPLALGISPKRITRRVVRGLNVLRFPRFVPQTTMDQLTEFGIRRRLTFVTSFFPGKRASETAIDTNKWRIIEKCSERERNLKILETRSDADNAYATFRLEGEEAPASELTPEPEKLRGKIEELYAAYQRGDADTIVSLSSLSEATENTWVDPKERAAPGYERERPTAEEIYRAEDGRLRKSLHRMLDCGTATVKATPWERISLTGLNAATVLYADGPQPLIEVSGCNGLIYVRRMVARYEQGDWRFVREDPSYGEY